MGVSSDQRSWDRKYCPNCRRSRVHLRVGRNVYCIGQLKDRKSASTCGPREPSAVLEREQPDAT